MTNNELSRGEVDDRDRALFLRLVPILMTQGRGSEALLEKHAVEGKIGGKRLLRAWLDAGIVDLEDLAAAVLEAGGIETIAVIPSLVPPRVWDHVSFQLCRDTGSIPLAFDPEAKTIHLAMVDPTNRQKQATFQRETGFVVTAVGGQHIGLTLNTIEQEREARAEIAANLADSPAPQVQFEEDDGAFTKLVASMISTAQLQRAVDIHLEPWDENTVMVQYRIDGVIYNIERLDARTGTRYINRIVNMADMDSAANRPADGSASTTYGMEGTRLDIRIVTSPTAWGIKKCVIRLLANQPHLLNLERLYQKQDLERWLEAVSTPTGLHIVVGKTGDGKPVAKNTPVLCSDGSLRNAGDLRRGDKVISGSGTPREVLNFLDQGELPCLRIVTTSGREIIAALDHPFLTTADNESHWKTTQNLSVGDNLHVLLGGPSPDNENVLATQETTTPGQPLQLEGSPPALLAQTASLHLRSAHTVSDREVVIPAKERLELSNQLQSQRVTRCDHHLDPIIRIEPAGMVDCCCIEVDVEHTYTVNGVVCHNSTTVAATLKNILLTPPSRKIITIENPVEIRISGLSQLPVNTRNADMSFERILESVLRQDPDVLNIGEIRSKESGEIGLMAAETGHSVFATMHIRSTAGAPGRLAGLGVSRVAVADSLNTVLSQRLVRKLCMTCRQPTEATDELLSSMAWPSQDLERPATLYIANPDGCDKCKSGYFGRFAVPEILVVDNEIRELIAGAALAQEIEKAAVAGGMIPLRTRALSHVANGDTSLEEINRHVDQ